MKSAADFAFCPGHLGNVAEIYWNGIPIGTRGSLDPYIGLPWTGGMAAYPVGDAPVYGDRENLVSIRIRNFFGAGGLLGPDPVVAPLDLLRYHIDRRQRIPALFMAGHLALLAALFTLSLPVAAWHRREAFGWCFAGLTGCELAMQCLRAQVLIGGSWPSLLATLVGGWLWAFGFPAFSVLMVHRVFGPEITRAARNFAWVSLGGGALMMPLAASPRLEMIPALVGAVLFLGALAWVAAIVIRACRNHEPQAGWAMAAVMATTASFAPDLLNYFGPFVGEPGRWTPPSSWGVLLFAGSFGVLAAARLVRHRERSRRLEERQFAIREDERARLARDLHDGASRNLAALKLCLELGEDGPLSSRERSRAIRLLEETSEDLRQAARDLHPAILNRIPVSEAMRTYCRMLDRSGTRINLEIADSLDEVDLRLAGQLYRIFQEALSNAAVHSQATSIMARVEVLGETVNLLVEDNGIGLNEAADRGSDGFGINSIRERADVEGGQAAWSGANLGNLGGGTRLRVTLPIRER